MPRREDEQMSCSSRRQETGGEASSTCSCCFPTIIAGFSEDLFWRKFLEDSEHFFCRNLLEISMHLYTASKEDAALIYRPRF